MNDEAVYRTAPATPGLLNIHRYLLSYTKQAPEELEEDAAPQSLIEVVFSVHIYFFHKTFFFFF